MDVASADLEHIRELYDRGLFLQAYDASTALGSLNAWDGPAGVLAGRLAGHLGASRLATALIMKAWRSTPTDAEAAYYYTYALRRRQGPWRAWSFTQKYDFSTAEPRVRSHAYAQRAALAADFRDFETAEDWLGQAEELSPGDPWLLVERSDVLAAQDRYDEALAAARQSLELRPDYVPALQRAVHLLPLLDRSDDAVALLTATDGRIESGGAAWQCAGLLLASDRYDDAEVWIRRAERYWPLAEKEARGWLAGRRSDLARRRGDVPASIDQGRRAGSHFHVTAAENLAQASSAASSVPPPVRLAVPFVKQRHLTCVPASLASLSRYWLRPIDPVEMARAVTYDGTPGHKARSWMEAAGWRVREFRVTAETAWGLIERGLPFAVVTVYPGSSHEQVVVGFDRGRRTLLIQDPGHAGVSEALADGLVEEQRAYGPRGVLLVPLDRLDALGGLELPDATLYDRLHDIETALDRHDRERAQAALAVMVAGDADHLLVVRARQVLASYDGDVTSLLECAEELVRRFPDNVPALQAKIWALRNLGRSNDAVSVLEDLSRRAALAPYFIEEHAAFLSDDARLGARSLQLANRALRIRPHEARVLSYASDVFWRAERRGEALALRRFAACLDEHTEGFVTEYFTTARYFRQAEDAVAWLRARHARLGASSTRPVRSLFWALEELGRTAEGFEALHRALAAHEDGELLAYAAEVHARYGRQEEAEDFLARARGRCRPSVWLRTAGGLAQQRGDAAAAIGFWRQVAESEPLATDAHTELARLIASQEGRRAAVEHLRLTAETFPHHHVLHSTWYTWARVEDGDSGEGVLRRLLALNPRDAWAHREMAIVLGRRGAFQEAEKELEAATALDPRSAAAHSVPGYVAALAGRVPEARCLYRAAVHADVNFLPGVDGLLGLPLSAADRREDLQVVHDEIVHQVLFGDVLFSYRRHAQRLLAGDEVLSALRAARDARPDLWQTWSAVVDQLRDMDELVAAAEEAEKACIQFPLVPALWLDRAHVARVRGDGEGERSFLETALGTGAEWGFAARRLAALRQGSEPERGRALLEQAVARLPLDAWNRLELAKAMWRAGERDGAWHQLERAAELEPRSSVIWETSAQWDAETDGPPRTPDRARSLTARRAGDPECWLMLARVLQGPEYLEERLAALDRAIAVAPHLDEAHDLKAEVLAGARRFDEAIAACQSGHWGVHRPRELRGREAWVEWQRGDTRAAVAKMTAVLEPDPDYYWGWSCLADWCLETTDLDGYLNAARQLVRLAPNEAVPLGFRGDAYRRLGRLKDAEADLERALGLNPEYGFARNWLAEMYLSDGRSNEVLQLFREHPGSEHDEYELGLRVRAHVSLEQYVEGVALVRELLLRSEADRAPLDRAVTFSEVPEWRGMVDDLIVELSVRSDVPPHAARLAVGLPAAEGSWKVCEKRLAGIPRETEGRRLALHELLDSLTRARAARVLERLIRHHRTELRATTSLWGSVGYALLSLRPVAKTREWLADWKDRPDAQPWMLHNLGLALRREDLRSQAMRVNAAALGLPADDTTPDHALWLSLDELVDGTTPTAVERLAGLQAPGEKERYRLFLWRLAVAARGLCTNEKPFSWFRGKVNAAARENDWFAQNPELLHLYIRLFWRLARRHGTAWDVARAAGRCLWALAALTGTG